MRPASRPSSRRPWRRPRRPRGCGPCRNPPWDGRRAGGAPARRDASGAHRRSRAGPAATRLAGPPVHRRSRPTRRGSTRRGMMCSSLSILRNGVRTCEPGEAEGCDRGNRIAAPLSSAYDRASINGRASPPPGPAPSSPPGRCAASVPPVAPPNGSSHEPDQLRHATAPDRHGGGRRGRPRQRAGRPSDAHRHLPEPQPAGHLRRPALRRHGPRADGRVAHQLLRVPLPLHRGHPPRREPERPGHGPDEARVPPRHQHGAGDGRDDRLRHPLAGLHAAGDRLAVHHPLRRRQRPGRLPRPLQRDEVDRRDPGPGPLQGPADVRQPPRRVGASPLRREPAARSSSGSTPTGSAPMRCRPTR